MGTKTPLPVWVRDLSKQLTDTIQFRVDAHMQGRYLPAGDGVTQINILELTPVRMDAAANGSDDRAQTGGVIHLIDLTNALDTFDDIYSLQYEYHHDGYPKFVFQGTKDQHYILVHLRLDPIDEAEVGE